MSDILEASGPRRAVTTIVTVATERGTFVLLGINDPRWRLDRKKEYTRNAALEANGAFIKFPLEATFIGGGVDPGQTDLKREALRELGEELGARLAMRITPEDLHPVHRVVRHCSRGEGPLEVTYYHAHLTMKYDKLLQSLAPNDDLLGVALVKPDKIRQTSNGYAVAGKPHKVVMRRYCPIPYEKWGKAPYGVIPESVYAAFRTYNSVGPADPMVGIDLSSIQRGLKLFAPPSCGDHQRLSPEELRRGLSDPVPDGAILQQCVGPRLNGRYPR